MDENCYVEPIHKSVPTNETLKADIALLMVAGMGCPNCATRVRNSLLSLDGVFGVDVYLNMAMAEVSYDAGHVTREALVNAIERAGNDSRHEYHARLISAE